MNSSDFASYLNITRTKLRELARNVSLDKPDHNDYKPHLSTRNCFIIFAYSVIIFFGIFGNLLVCNLVIRNQNLRSTTYVFIANLALSDLIMTVLNVPFNLSRMVITNWQFGTFMCSFVPFIQVITVYVSTFTMTCIAIDRHKVICQPLKPRMKSLQALKVITAVWVLAFILSFPYAIYNKVATIFTFRSITRCQVVFPDALSPWIELTTLLMQYVIPLFVIGVLYCRIVTRVWSRATLGVVTEAQLISHAKSKRKTIKMLMLVVILFAICWLPLNVYHVLREFFGTKFMSSSESHADLSTIYFVCHWLAMSSVCYNPFIYCWLNDHFRVGALYCFTCIHNMCRNITPSIRSVGKIEQENPEASIEEVKIESRFNDIDVSSKMSEIKHNYKSSAISTQDRKVENDRPCNTLIQL